MSNESEESEHLSDPDFLSNFVSQFTPRDARSLRVNFRPARNAGEVIPQLIPNNRVNIPQEYVLQNVNRVLLLDENINIDQLSQDNYVKTFIRKLQVVVMNAKAKIGTSESWTDTLVAHILYHIFDFDQFPLWVNLHPRLEFQVGGHVQLTAIPEFVVKNQKYILLVVEDKHLGNTSLGPANNYGEPQIAGEILACGNEDVHESRVIHDVTVFVARVISTYVTFYRATIKEEYWDELADGCSRNQSITVTRWPASSDPKNGFDLAEPNGRRAVLDAFNRIHIIISAFQP